MDQAKATARIRDEEREKVFGYVFSVSGPGESCVSLCVMVCV
jgi:hypothetical protein